MKPGSPWPRKCKLGRYPLQKQPFPRECSQLAVNTVKLLSAKSCSSSLLETLTKKSVVSSQPEKLVRRSEADIRAYAKSPAAKKASALLQENIRKHGLEPSAADLKEIPELTDEELSRM